ncbi:unnamed protein product [Tuber aestivum]|uniref:Uncharacterized protein n=1 Tax=Tuber aestivum TaxID=59557 RepID=A0A292PSL5_9PEZI|nr:unnamed protein product [Tuber aestivum]
MGSNTSGGIIPVQCHVRERADPSQELLSPNPHDYSYLYRASVNGGFQRSNDPLRGCRRRPVDYDTGSRNRKQEWVAKPHQARGYSYEASSGGMVPWFGLCIAYSMHPSKEIRTRRFLQCCPSPGPLAYPTFRHNLPHKPPYPPKRYRYYPGIQVESPDL